MATIRERKSKDGKVSYFAEVRIKGHPPVRQSFNRKTDAKRWVTQTEAAIRERRFFGSQEALKKTFADMVTRYIENELPKRKTDHKKIETHLTWWKKHLGAYVLADITPQMIAELRDKLSNEWIMKGKKTEKVRRKPATVKLYMASLSIVYSIAEKEWGWVERNPVLSVRKPKVNNGRMRFLDKDEQKKLLDAARADRHPYIYDLIVLALCTGARWGEITGLMWKEVDLKTTRPVIRLEPRTKNGERRTIPITGPSVQVLKSRKKSQVIHSPFVFPRADGKKPMEMRKLWERVLEASELDDFTFHDLRHTTASNLAMNGASLLEIAQILGHKTLSMVKRYSHLTEQHTHDILERMNQAQFA